jgi:CheY-like chemotaxis protein
VVDDQPEFLEFAAMRLGGDHRLRSVGKAAHGRDALALAAQTEPDAALVDINMPGLDGFEVTRRLRAAQPDLRVVLMTAVMEQEYKLLATKVESLACIAKSEVAPARLLRLLEPGAQPVKGSD